MIEFKKAVKSFKLGEEKWTLGLVDLKVETGESVAIIGPSGSGKSTLLHLAGALTDLDSGSIEIFDKDLTEMSAKEVRNFRNQQVGFVFQDFFLFPEFTLIENVEIPLLIAKVSKKEARERAKKVLKEVGLSHRENHHSSELSGGQRQRGAIARALIIEPEFLLADEPTGNLDKINSQKIVDLILEMQKKRNMTLLLATHDDRVAEICSRKVELDNGKIISDNKI